ncbi:hypothetical protein BKA83DRAFT_4128494 [Pisolithus microcarpus]|nr:hypothetical protein BKA83DRAFT_4128494 [Pisolithus microcarpus]
MYYSKWECKPWAGVSQKDHAQLSSKATAWTWLLRAHGPRNLRPGPIGGLAWPEQVEGVKIITSLQEGWMGGGRDIVWTGWGTVGCLLTESVCSTATQLWPQATAHGFQKVRLGPEPPQAVPSAQGFRPGPAQH